MGRKCCVTGCNGNYDKQNEESTFRLPSDPEEKKRWLQALPRDNIPLTKDTAVCERHWKKEYPSVMCFGKPRPRDPPSEFFCVKSSLVPTPSPFQEQQQKPCHQSETKKMTKYLPLWKKTKYVHLMKFVKILTTWKMPP